MRSRRAAAMHEGSRAAPQSFYRRRGWPPPARRNKKNARPLGALLSSPGLDVRLMTALQVLQVRAPT